MKTTVFSIILCLVLNIVLSANNTPEPDQVIPVQKATSACDRISGISYCGQRGAQSTAIDGTGSWHTSNANSCGNICPGDEWIYLFVAPVTGTYSIHLQEVEVPGGTFDYMWQEDSCSETGWNCIGAINTPGDYGSMSWTAGTWYYLLVDSETESWNCHQFYINYPVTTSPLMEYFSYAIDDDNNGNSSGNGNGIIEPGETIELQVTFINRGGATAHNVNTTLFTPVDDISIITDNQSLGDVPEGSISTSGSFVFEVSSDCESKGIGFYLTMTTDEDTWQEMVSIYVHADQQYPLVEALSHEADDDNSGNSAGNNNGLIEPGETIEMPIIFINNGNISSTWIEVYMTTSDPDITMNNYYIVYGEIAPGATASSKWGDIYEFEVSEDCPEKDVTFTMYISSSNSYRIEEFTVHVYGLADPCESVIPINGFGSSYPKTYTGGGNGSWHTGEFDFDVCGFSAPGIEQIYSFTAPETGQYSVQVTATDTSWVDYMWKASSCSSDGWTCIADVETPGQKGPMSLIAGTTYYLLLDDEDTESSTHTFYINSPESIKPNIILMSMNVIDFAGGDGDNLAEPGESINWSPSFDNIGDGYLRNVTGILSTIDPDVTITSGSASWPDMKPHAGYAHMGYQFTVSDYCLEKDVPFKFELTGDEGTWTFNFSVHIYGLPNPCNNIIAIPAFGSEHSMTFSESGSGSLHTGENNVCGHAAPGKEQIYSFTPAITGDYSIQVSATNTSRVDYMWQASLCNANDWNCIAAVETPGKWGSMAWIAGSTYYLLLDDETTESSTHTFYINSPDEPDINFNGYSINDSEYGDGDHLAECNETVELHIHLENTGGGYLRNAKGILSTDETGISLTADTLSWGDVHPHSGNTNAGYGFTVSYRMLEKDVPFTFKLTGDEGSWTFNFSIHIYGLPDPCNSVISIPGCGPEYSTTFNVSGSGSLFGDYYNSCEFLVPGKEQVYSIYAPVTGDYYFHVTAADNSRVDYMWDTSCVHFEWYCIGDIQSPGTYGPMPWIAGNTYYVLLDDEDTDNSIHTFYITSPGIYPVLEFEDYVISDSDEGECQGDNDGIAEAGECIRLAASLSNVGTGNAHNVWAVLSTTDTAVSFSHDTLELGIIYNDSSVVADHFIFQIAENCPEKDVTFNIDIYSDEGDWSDELTLHVSAPATAPLLEYYSSSVDESSGDDDGQAEAGESVDMSVMLYNSGTTAHDVIAFLSTNDPDISITDSTGEYEVIESNDSLTCTACYSFSVSEECTEKDVTLILNMVSDEGQWEDEFTLHIFDSPGPDAIDVHEAVTLSVYPNPVREQLFLETEKDIHNAIFISVFDIDGKKLYSSHMKEFLKGELLEIDLSHFKSGIYLLELIQPESVSIKKIAKQ